MKPTLCHLRAAVLTLAVMTLASVAGAVTSNTASKPAARPVPAEPGAQSSHLPDRFAGQAGRYYRLVWGIDSLEVKTAESGQMIRFSWRVLDPGLARALNDKRAEPALVDQSAGVRSGSTHHGTDRTTSADGPAGGRQILLDGVFEQGPAGQAGPSGRCGDWRIPGRGTGRRLKNS